MSISVSITGPLVDVSVSDALESSDLPALLDAMDTARRAGPFVVLTDTLHMKSISRTVATDFADGLKKLPPLKNVWLGDAVVVNSAIARFVLSRLIIVASLPTEVKVFETRSAALSWLVTVLDQNNARVPIALRTAV